jgi:peptidoglycan/LPS O-acetylase OafA/YrhL
MYARPGALVAAANSVAIMTCGWISQREWWFSSLIVAAVAFTSLPSLFELTRRNRTDAMIGEFSYPMYLWHATIGFFAAAYVAQWGAWFLAIASIMATVPLVFLIEAPLERWRSTRVERARSIRFKTVGKIV